MVRSPCCDGTGLKKGPWTPEEDKKLVEYIQKNGHGSWRALPKLSGLNRCGKSCRLRWANYLRPDIKRGKFTEDEDRLIIRLHSVLGNKWSAMATRLPGRTDNEIKNYWNTHLRKKLLQMGIDPVTHRQRSDLNLLANLPSLLAASNFCNLANPWDNALRLQADAAQLARIQLLQSLIQVLSTNSPANLDATNLVGSGILRNYQSSDLFQMNNQSQALFDTALGLPKGTAGQNTLNPSNVGTTRLQNEFQSLAQSPISVDDRERISQINSSCVNSSLAVDHPTIGSTANSTPSLVSAMDQMQDQINANEVCVNSFKSDDVFEPWEELNLDEPIGDFNWKDVLDQMNLPTWSITT